MNSSSIFISSSGESRVKRLRIGTPSLARRSNLRRISYFSFITNSSFIFRDDGAGKKCSALRFSRPSDVRTGPVSSRLGTRRGADSASPKLGSSTVAISGRSIFDSEIFVFVKKSAPKISPICVKLRDSYENSNAYVP